MPMNFDVSQIKDHATVTTSPYNTKRWHPVTESIISLALICGFSKITKENVDVVWRRIKQYQNVFGALYQVDYGKTQVLLSREDVEMHIGFSSNASAVSDNQWTAYLIRMIDEKSQGPEVSGYKVVADHVEKMRSEIAEKMSST